MKNRKILILLCVELAVFLWGAAGLFGASGMAAGEEMTAQLLEEGIPLSAGSYRVRLYCEAEADGVSTFDVTAGETPYKTLRHNAVPVYRGLAFQEAQFYLSQKVDHLRVVVSGAENLQIQAIEIVATAEGGRVFLFWVVLISLVVNGVVLLILRHGKEPIPVSKRLVLLGIPALAILSSLPVLVDYNLGGEELSYQLMRIEAFGRGGRGGNLFLFFPALLRIIGFPPGAAYQLYIAAVNMATAAVSYYAFRKCAGQRRQERETCAGEGMSAEGERLIGMFGSILYVLLPCRLHAIYVEAAVDEYTAMIFLPLLAWGFYRIYTKDDGERGYLWSFAASAGGFFCLICSCLSVSLWAAGIWVLLCLLLPRKTFRPRRLLALGLTALTTAALSVGFLVPLIDLARDGRQLLESHGAELFGVVPADFDAQMAAEGAAASWGVGLVLPVCLLVFFFLFGKRRSLLAFLGCGALFLGSGVILRVFGGANPWSVAARWWSPTGFAAVAGVCLTTAACIEGACVFTERKGALTGKNVLILLAVSSLLFGSCQLDDILLTGKEFVRIYTAQSLPSWQLLKGDYLLETEGAAQTVQYCPPALSEGVEQSSCEKEGTRIESYVKTGEKGGYIDYPLPYCKGYKASVRDTGEALSVEKGENGNVRVFFPENFAGQVEVGLAGMWYWRGAEAVSAVTGLLLLAGCLVRLVFCSGNRRHDT